MKNLKLFVILFSLLYSNLCFAQSGWFWQNPLPTSSQINDNYIFNSQRYLLVTNGGLIIETTNNGVNWKYSQTGSSISLKTISFINANTGWIAGNDFTISKTTNGGMNWSTQNGGIPNIYKLTFIDSLNGWAVGNVSIVYTGSIIRTTNGGVSWIHYSTGINTPLKSLFFLDNKMGWCGSNALYKTNDKGVSWIGISNFSSTINSILFLDSLNGWIVLENGKTIKSSNGGYNWIEKEVNNTEPLYTIKSIDNIHVWSAGRSGVIQYTSTGGNNWQNINRGIKTDLTEVIFENDNIGFVVGKQGYISRTQDGGLNWITINSGTNKNLSSISLLNSGGAIITGDTGLIIKTTNYGENWQSITSNVNFNLNRIFFTNSTTGWIVGDGAYILKTTNSGNNFSLINSGINGGFKSIYFVNVNTGYIIQTDKIYKSTNSGLNWVVKLDMNSASYYDFKSIVFADTNTGLAVGSSVLKFPPFTRYGFILKTVNGGEDWSISLSTALQSYFYEDIVYSSNSIYYVTGLGGIMLKTINSGNNWTIDPIGTGSNMFSIHFSSLNTGWVIGSNGSILKTNTGGISIGLETQGSIIPNKFNLSQNYPNPFNPQTKIKFAVPSNVKGQTSNVKLVIYDLLGREVTTLVNEELKPGIYEADWDGSNYSSGVYFYKIISKGFVETKKMVLMK